MGPIIANNEGKCGATVNPNGQIQAIRLGQFLKKGKGGNGRQSAWHKPE
jgi:hypothetical protein